jgi:hypothetical protein
MPGRLSAFLYGERISDRETVTVLDVGCSGGLGDIWNIFGPALRGIGFDLLESEIERLKQTERRPNIDYEAAYVGLNRTQEAERSNYESNLSSRERFHPKMNLRSSYRSAARILSYDYHKEFYNAGADKAYSSRKISLDEFFERRSLKDVDILKTDTDSHDVEVLIGAEKLLRSTLLAVSIECCFHEIISPYSNNFANIDNILRSSGFQLFDLRPQTYSRSALPGPFQYDLLAQTKNGAPLWGDALYLRDLAHPDYEMLFDFHAAPERIIKLACVMEAFDLQDCAAELIINQSERLPYPLDQMLDLLVPNTLGPNLSYREYMDRYKADPKVLLPSRLAKKTPTLPFMAGARQELSLEKAQSFPDWGATLSPSADGKLRVTTSHHQWAYAMILPLPDHQGPGILAVEAEIIEGEVGVSVANADHTELAAETILSLESKGNTIILPVSAMAARGALMIRNTSREGPSRVSISRVTFFAD